MPRKLSLCITWITLSIAAAGTAEAQISLSAPRLPGVPALGAGLPGGGLGFPGELTPDVDRAASGLGNDVDVRQLTDARRRRIAQLLRRYPRLVERDPRGAAILRGEVVALAPTDAALSLARMAGFGVVRSQRLGALGARIVVLRAPAGVSTQQALQRLRALDPAGTYDFNHLYTESGTEASAGPGVENGGTATTRVAQSAGGHPSAAAPSSTGAVARVGLIDSGVDARHPAFHDVPVHLHGCAGATVPAAHGTEVASLIAGRAPGFHGAVPGAELFAADVYCGLPAGASIDRIADAFDWLVGERVPVINVSLVGPPNALLASIVRLVIARGSIIVAAVGNDGPAAPPLYPAAYPGVVGVTGVDAERHVLMEAERGAQVTFAAPGADMAAALPPRAYAVVRGTSFAAPIVAGLLATSLAAPDPAAAARAVKALERHAIDLGAPGLDPVYGYGLVGANLRPVPTLARAQ